jgi:hypothetical protein
MNACFYMDQATQSGLIQSTATGMTSMSGTVWNNAANNCLNGSVAADCGGSPGYYNVNYNALLGNSFDGQGVSGAGAIDTVRVAACRLCVIANNTFQNANNLGAVFRLHSANTATNQMSWIGQYTEYVEISDNLFTGAAGAQLVETAPQTQQYDERLRNIVLERNLFRAVSGGSGRQILVSALNETLRDNVFYVTAGDVTPPQYAAQVAQRGVEPLPQYVELYNNTCYALQTTTRSTARWSSITAAATASPATLPVLPQIHSWSMPVVPSSRSPTSSPRRTTRAAPRLRCGMTPSARPGVRAGASERWRRKRFCAWARFAFCAAHRLANRTAALRSLAAWSSLVARSCAHQARRPRRRSFSAPFQPIPAG